MRVTSHPCHLALSTEKGSVPFLVSKQGTRVGTGVLSGRGGTDSREAGGLNAQCPRGPSSLGNSFPSSLPPTPWLSCTITKECCRPLKHQVFLPKPLGRTSAHCPLIRNCLLIVPLLWHLSHQIKMTCFLSFVLNQTMGSRRAENAAQHRTESLTHLNAQ